MRVANFSSTVGRGVFLAPWQGPNGELILVAVNRQNCRIGERVLAPGDGHVQASDDLWELVEREDPMPVLKVI